MSSDEAPLTIGRLVREWIHRRFGRRGLIVLALIGFVAAAWIYREDIKALPGISTLLDYLFQDSIPQADPARFSVLVAHLENDANDEHRRLIIETIREFTGVQALRLDRTIPLGGSIPEVVESEGHERARAYLSESGASVLIWGTVLSYGGQTKPKLFMTATGIEPRTARQYTPEIGAEFRLPELFWSGLADVLRLHIAAQSGEFESEAGRFVADRLPAFISRVERLLETSKSRPGWNALGSGLIAWPSKGRRQGMWRRGSCGRACRSAWRVGASP